MVKKKNKLGQVRTLIFLCALVVGTIAFITTQAFLTSHHTTPCANSKSCHADLSQKIETNAVGIFQGKKVYPPRRDTLLAEENVLGASTATASGEKHIYVDKSTQTLYAYQGNTLLLKTLVSTGKWQETPTGNFHIWEKLLATRMSGGEGDEAYDLPNVPYVMYFYSDFGLHGAYWHDNFGHKMSHGCVNLRQVDAKALYEWADGPSDGNLGTAVSICDNIQGGQCIQQNPIQ